ncbi:LPS assembly lipoprotein LptE [Jeongeupia wiesaeckerbachi]|uniref:LPS-assembly lipoprotein LptE n=1 Tax=Jeongeupia wiesaeckerbachi TaxID=3051218 RepID=UPI003D8074AC
MRYLLIVATLLLTACGFHLRGQGAGGAFPYATATVSGGGGTANALREYLSVLPDVKLLDKPDENTAKIDIVSEGDNQKVLTVNSSGRVSEYRVYYTVRFRVRQGDNYLIDDGKVQLFRDYTYDENNPLGEDAEKAQLVEGMQRDASQNILRRINAAARNAEKIKANPPPPKPSQTEQMIKSLQ